MPTPTPTPTHTLQDMEDMFGAPTKSEQAKQTTGGREQAEVEIKIEGNGGDGGGQHLHSIPW